MSESDREGHPAARGSRRVGLLVVLAVLAMACFAFYRHESRVRWLKETFKADRIRPLQEGAFAYVFDLPEEAERQRTDPTNDFVRENGYVLPHPEASADSICAQGAGRYRLESGRVVFSSTDNSDPRTNGRTYQYRFRGHKQPLARQAWQAGFFACLAALALAVAWSWKFTLKVAWDRLRAWDARAWSRGLDPLLLLVALPTVLLAMFGSQAVFFDSPGYLDPLMYVGYFLHYEEHLPLFDDYYKISRLPWIWPGVAAYRAFGPMAGSYVLHGGALIFASCSIFLTVRDTLEDRRAAVIAAILFVSYPYALGPGGWNYHITITVGYYVTSLWCLSRAARAEQPKAWLLGAGAAIACAVHTHLFCVVYLPLQALHLAVMLGRRLRLEHVLLVFLGGCLATLVFAVGNFATGGDFLFFMRQIKYTMHLSREGNYMYLPATEWLHQATWLMLPLAVAMGSAMSVVWKLARQHTRSGRLNAILFPAEFVLVVFIHAYFQFVRNQTVLQPAYGASILHGWMFLALGGLLNVAFGNQKAARPFVFGFGAVGLCFLPLLVVPGSFQANGLQALAGSGWAPLSCILLPGLLAIGVAALLGRFSTLAIWPALLLWGMALLAIPSSLSFGLGGVHLHNRDLFRTYMAFHEFALPMDSSLRGIKFWFDEKEVLPTASGPLPMNGVYNSCLSVRGWLGNLLAGSPIPPVEELERKHFSGVSMVGILSRSENLEAAAKRMQVKLDSWGIAHAELGTKLVQSGEVRYSVVVYGLSRTETGFDENSVAP